MEERNSDLKMLNLTWNMGGSEKVNFMSIRDELLVEADQYDLIAVCV